MRLQMPQHRPSLHPLPTIQRGVPYHPPQPQQPNLNHPTLTLDNVQLLQLVLPAGLHPRQDLLEHFAFLQNLLIIKSNRHQDID